MSEGIAEDNHEGADEMGAQNEKIDKLYVIVEEVSEKLDLLLKKDADRDKFDEQCISDRKYHGVRIGDIQRVQSDMQIIQKQTTENVAKMAIKQEKADEVMVTLTNEVTVISGNMAKFMVYVEGFLVFVKAGGMTWSGLFWLSKVCVAIGIIYGALMGLFLLAQKIALMAG